MGTTYCVLTMAESIRVRLSQRAQHACKSCRLPHHASPSLSRKEIRDKEQDNPGKHHYQAYRGAPRYQGIIGFRAFVPSPEAENDEQQTQCREQYMTEHSFTP